MVGSKRKDDKKTPDNGAPTQDMSVFGMIFSLRLFDVAVGHGPFIDAGWWFEPL